MALPMQEGGVEMSEFIKRETTPEQFDLECAKYPKYKLTHGGRSGLTALGAAAIVGNSVLIEHIVKIAGENLEKELLALGNEAGCTPLYLSVIHEKFWAAKTLIFLGADVNMAPSQEFQDPSSTSYERKAGTTPLFTSIHHQDLNISILLLKHQAVAEPQLSSGFHRFLNNALSSLRNSQNKLHKGIKEGTKDFNIPSVLTEIIEEYVDVTEAYVSDEGDKLGRKVAYPKDIYTPGAIPHDMSYD